MLWHDVEQNTDEWMLLRTGLVTMSAAGKFMANEGKTFGDPAKDYALQIALEIITGKKAEFSFSNEHMERGHAQEPIARTLYEDMYFVSVTNGGFFNCGDYGTSPDGLVGDDGGVEIKSVVAKTHYATLRRGSFDPAYKWQLIGHLDCTGRDWFDFVSYCSDFPEDKQIITHRLHRVEYEDELSRLAARRDDFIHLINDTVTAIIHG